MAAVQTRYRAAQGTRRVSAPAAIAASGSSFGKLENYIDELTKGDPDAGRN